PICVLGGDRGDHVLEVMRYLAVPDEAEDCLGSQTTTPVIAVEGVLHLGLRLPSWMDDAAEADDIAFLDVLHREHAVAAQPVVGGRHLKPPFGLLAGERLSVAYPAHGVRVAIDGEECS